MKLKWLRFSSIGSVVALTLGLAATLSADNGPAHQTFQSRPIKLGTSGGNIKDRSTAWCCSGTLGALVTKGGVQYVLSNNHVLARTNKASTGDDIIQPGLIDQNPVCFQDANDAVADLSEWEPILFSRGTTNVVDAAIAEVRSSVSYTGGILDIGTVSDSPAAAWIGMRAPSG